MAALVRARRLKQRGGRWFSRRATSLHTLRSRLPGSHHRTLFAACYRLYRGFLLSRRGSAPRCALLGMPRARRAMRTATSFCLDRQRLSDLACLHSRPHRNALMPHSPRACEHSANLYFAAGSGFCRAYSTYMPWHNGDAALAAAAYWARLAALLSYHRHCLNIAYRISGYRVFACIFAGTL